jgi:hypothetical protein
MRHLGYVVDKRGMCFGFSHMAMQAILARDAITYNARLRKISQRSVADIKHELDTVHAAIKRIRHKNQPPIIDRKPPTIPLLEPKLD